MLYFVCISRIDLGGNYAVRKVTDLWMPHEAPPILLLHPKRLMTESGASSEFQMARFRFGRVDHRPGPASARLQPTMFILE